MALEAGKAIAVIDQILTAGLAVVLAVFVVWMLVIQTSGLTVNALL